MSLTDKQKAKNAEAENCSQRRIGRWVPCDHKYCWDPANCTDQEYEEEDHCRMQAVHSKLDICNCGKEYHYP